VRGHAAGVRSPVACLMARPMPLSVVPEGRAGPQQAAGNPKSPCDARSPQEIPA
jgi:hypothetical protein